MEAQQHRLQGNAYEDQDEVVLEEKVGLKTALDDDPNAPKEENTASNYQSKVTDPTGPNSEEAGTTPLVQSFEKMSAKEETKPEKGAESKSTDREVSKMKEYLADKFKPREEDKALSEVISGKLSGPTAATHGEGSGKSMIDRLKGAASSLWVRKRGGKEATQTPSTREGT